MPTFNALHQRTVLRRLVFVLLTLLVLAQTLGWMHRGLHGAERQLPGISGLGSVQHPGASVACDDEAVHGWVKRLFASHEDVAQCQLFDVVTHAGGTPMLAIVPDLVPATARLVHSHSDFVARWASLFDARGPPAFRS